MEAGTIRVRLTGDDDGTIVVVTCLMHCDPGEVKLGALSFDISDDAELMAFHGFMKSMSKAGAIVENKNGVIADPADLFEVDWSAGF